MRPDARVEDLLRGLSPQVLGVLVRRHGRFDQCEDAVQEALLAASLQWPADGVPENPWAWLLTVASRRLIDQLRSEASRSRREQAAAAMEPANADAVPAPGLDAEDAPREDDTLTLLLLCCHPSLTPSSQVALTLRAVGGLTTAEIAAAFFVPEATMAQRISRAKSTIRASGVGFELPRSDERGERLAAVERVLYLIFNEGYTASSGGALARGDLIREAIRLARELRRMLPDDSDVAGLLALMLLTEARRPARITAAGDLVPLADQDRSLWNRELIDEGVALVTAALAHGPAGSYQLQAAIAAVHAEAPSAEATDWRQITALYELLERVAPTPMVTLNHAVALAMARGPDAGLRLLETLQDDPRIASHHRLHAVRAHMLERAGDHEGACAEYRRAAAATTSLPERRYLERCAVRLAADGAGSLLRSG